MSKLVLKFESAVLQEVAVGQKEVSIDARRTTAS